MPQSFKSRRDFSLATLASNKSSVFNETLVNQAGEMNEQPSITTLAAVCTLATIALLGTIANLSVLKAILSVKRKKVYEYFILNLAVTDVGTCVVSIPLDIVEHLVGRFPYGAALCHVIYPFQSVLLYVSTMTLVLMSVERYRLIVTPMKRAIGINTGFIIIVGIWILSFLVVLPFSFALKLTETRCSEQWHKYSAKVFTLAVFIFLYLGPLSFMTFSYARMIYVLSKEIKALKKRKRRKSISKELIDTRLHRNAKIGRVFVVVMAAFVLCMLPTHAIWLWHDFGERISSSDFGKLVTFSNILVYWNSALDPLILGFIMVDFRAEIKHCRKSFCCCLKRFRRSWDLEKAFVIGISPSPLTEQYKSRSYFLSG